MWFYVLSLLIAGLCIGKAVIALLAPKQFYGFRRRQYASAQRPLSIFFVPTLMIALTVGAWYATLMHYMAGGWKVTGFLTFFAVMAVINLRRWSIHRAALFQAISRAQTASRQRVDGAILCLGLFFLGSAPLLEGLSIRF